MWTNILDFSEIRNLHEANFFGVFQNDNFTQNINKIDIKITLRVHIKIQKV